jgi:PAS domain S-box-containing protein
MRLAGGGDPHVLTAKSPVPVLIVDDNRSKRLALKSVLSPLGYLIVEAASGTEALRCVMARDFAVILLDVCMPGMDGFETAALIRQRRQSEMTPIIFITAFASDEIQTTDLYAEGAVDFIFAPVPPAELQAKVSVFANLFTRAEELAARAREVQESADQLRLLTDAAPIGIFQTDVENRYVYTNPRWSEITGVRPEQAAGKPWDSILDAQDRAGLPPARGEDMLYRGEVCDRFEIRSASGPSRVLLLTSRSIPDSEGGVAGWVGTLADVTAEAGAEAAMSDARDEANEGSRLKSDFLANMSHEIRTPMNGIIGMTDLLLETDLDVVQRDYAQTVRNSGEALLTIINDILDFSKVEAGKLELEQIDFSLRSIVDDVVNLLARAADDKGLKLTGIVEDSVPTVVTGDPGRVRQVLTNLVGNAIKFTRSGHVVVRTALVDGASTDTGIRFEVSDTGDGIAPEKLETVFQPFVQADTSTSRRYGGTGLGLAISGQLVALMGGECGVSSELGAGSTFWFTIRVRVDLLEHLEELLPDADLAGVTVLVVGDNGARRSVVSEYLSGWGMTVRTADSGAPALATLRTAAAQGRPFDLALLESMPHDQAEELERTILSEASLTARPVVRPGRAAPLSELLDREMLRTSLRLALETPAADVALVGPRSSERRGPEGGRLLLAEDNLINQKVAIAMLSSAGYEVDIVANGEIAVHAASAQHYDVILMDCHMPVLNGYDATVAIRAREGSERHTPIIALTASARREDRERCLSAGMDNYLAKPVSKDALLALVGRYARVEPAADGSTRTNGAKPAAAAQQRPQ